MRNKYGKCTEFFTFTIRTYTHTNVCEQKQSQIAYIFCTICGDISFFSGSPRWVHAKSLQSCLTLCDPMDVAHQAPLSMRFSRQEQRSGLPCPPPGDLPNPGIKPMSLTSPALAGEFFTTSATWEALSSLNAPNSKTDKLVSLLFWLILTLKGQGPPC